MKNLKITPMVVCNIHGTQLVKGVPQKFVKVPVPKTKKQRLHGGCPQCQREAKQDT